MLLLFIIALCIMAFILMRNSYNKLNESYDIMHLSDLDQVLSNIQSSEVLAIDVRYDYYFSLNHVTLEMKSGRMIHLNVSSIPMLDIVLERVKQHIIK